MLFSTELQKRTIYFAYSIIDLCYILPKNIFLQSSKVQLIKSATSIGANYSEAIESVSRKEMAVKICISKKEIKETIYWLIILYKYNTNYKQEIKNLLAESDELIKIFSKFYTSLIRKA